MVIIVTETAWEEVRRNDISKNAGGTAYYFLCSTGSTSVCALKLKLLSSQCRQRGQGGPCPPGFSHMKSQLFAQQALVLRKHLNAHQIS